MNLDCVIRGVLAAAVPMEIRTLVEGFFFSQKIAHLTRNSSSLRHARDRWQATSEPEVMS